VPIGTTVLLPPFSARTLELTGRVARGGSAVQAELADIDTLVDLLRIIVLVALRNARSLLLREARLLLRTRGKADC
jgi:hypothetical protein